jgi:hypothetical protein
MRRSNLFFEFSQSSSRSAQQEEPLRRGEWRCYGETEFKIGIPLRAFSPFGIASSLMNAVDD